MSTSEFQSITPIPSEEKPLNLDKLRTLRQYRGLTDEQILAKQLETEGTKERILEERRQKRLDKFQVDGIFIDDKEKKYAKSLLLKYLEDYIIETISDKNTLKQLVYLEILNIRLQNQLNNCYKDEKIIPDKLVDSIHKNIEKIVLLKNQLGLIHSKEEAEKNDGFQALELLKKKASLWQAQNQGSRTAICPFCGKMILFKIRTDKYEASKHPFFRDKVLCNKHLMDMYSENKIAKEDIAKILDCSDYYVDWLLNKYFRKEPEVIEEPIKTPIAQ